ncbi:hypothetical protein HMN09_00327000 [Mycena chlorophos]|uniref:CxC6 like cysteine cluster associated with KDZ domain-containing protein n=1 Tax=Mycena chlorophos TaxID=658473 RepID=A0A8H6TI80_MYCCL|nr:hypothetical protein HMN09_00327000 [Mycena chlorophos]
MTAIALTTPNISKYIQIGEHQFAEYKLIAHWIGLQLTSWVSFTNCARSYDLSLSGAQEQAWEKLGWQFGWLLTPNHIFDAFITLTLLQYHNRRGTTLVVPHTGAQEDRFVDEMRRRNREVVKFGHENTVRHRCDKCTLRRWKDPETGHERDVQAVVGDGISMGHPCCAKSHCMKDLSNNRDRYCPSHQDEDKLCAIIGCDAPRIPPTKTCAESDHIEMERLHTLRGTSVFTLRGRLEKHRVSHPDEISDDEEAVPAADNDEWFTVNANPTAVLLVKMILRRSNPLLPLHLPSPLHQTHPCEASKTQPGIGRYKAQFGRRRTHNEFMLSFPCSLIAGRGTMHTAEATSNALKCGQQVFSVPGARKPNFFIYDTNCDAKQQVENNKTGLWKWWADVKMPVDVFHFFHKHSIEHVFCQKWCNPAMFPELLVDGDKWFFNSSVAEQNNVWFGGYHSMCREMTAVRYNFFLDEMIRLRNLQTLAKLEASGANPGFF